MKNYSYKAAFCLLIFISWGSLQLLADLQENPDPPQLPVSIPLGDDAKGSGLPGGEGNRRLPAQIAIGANVTALALAGVGAGAVAFFINKKKENDRTPIINLIETYAPTDKVAALKAAAEEYHTAWEGYYSEEPNSKEETSAEKSKANVLDEKTTAFKTQISFLKTSGEAPLKDALFNALEIHETSNFLKGGSAGGKGNENFKKILENNKSDGKKKLKNLLEKQKQLEESLKKDKEKRDTHAEEKKFGETMQGYARGLGEEKEKKFIENVDTYVSRLIDDHLPLDKAESLKKVVTEYNEASKALHSLPHPQDINSKEDREKNEASRVFEEKKRSLQDNLNTLRTDEKKSPKTIRGGLVATLYNALSLKNSSRALEVKAPDFSNSNETHVSRINKEKRDHETNLTKRLKNHDTLEKKLQGAKEEHMIQSEAEKEEHKGPKV